MFDLFGGIGQLMVQRDDGTRLALVSSVPDDDPGTTYLCVHGFTGGKEDWIFVLSDLRGLGDAGYALDLRGCHDSTSDGPFDVDTLAADVVAVAESLDTRPVLVGHSFGGLVAQRALIQSPGSFAALQLMCTGPAGFRHSADLIPITIERISMFDHELATKSIEDAWDAKTAYENVEMHPAMASFLRGRFVTGSHAAAVQNIHDLLDAPDVIDQVKATKVPCFVMYGENDGTWNQATQNDMARRLGTKPTAIGDATHAPMLENVDETVEVLRRNTASLQPRTKARA